MVRTIKQQCFSWLGAAALTLGFAQASQAQSIIWGAGHSNTQIDSMGQFAKTNTDSTLNGTGWTATQVAYYPWTWSATGRSIGDFSGVGDTIHSPSLANGVAMFDSDRAYAIDNNGVPQESYLTSPVIDASGFADSLVFIKFYTKIRDYNTDSARVAISIDGGATWATDADVQATLGAVAGGSPVEDWVMINVSSAFAGATNLTNCKIRFHFLGDSYYWAIDDISLVTAAPYQDLALDVNVAPAVPTNYAIQPLSQVNADELSWGAKVHNSGVLTSPASKLRVNIWRETTPGTWVTEVMDSMNVPSLAPDSAITLFSLGIGNNWMPTQVANYRAQYYIDAPTTQSDLGNDTLLVDFEISADDYMSKVPLGATGFPAATNATRAVPGTGNRLAEFEYGALFFFPTGQTDSITLDKVLGTVASGNVAAGATSSNVGARVYKFIDQNADGSWDFTAPDGGGELTVVGIGLDTNLALTPTGYKNVTINIVDIGGNALCLLDTSFYLVTLAQSNSNGLTNASSQNLGFYVGIYEDINYSINADSLPATFFWNSVFRRAECSGTSGPCSAPFAANRWNIFQGFETNSPSLGLQLTKCTPVGVSKTNNAFQNVNVFPNPTTGHLNVQVSFEETQKAVQYIMTDVTGRVVVFQTNKNVQSETAVFNVENLAQGVYFMTIRTDKGSSTQRFVKQ